MPDETFEGFKVLRGTPIKAGRREIAPVYLIGRNRQNEWEQIALHLHEGEDITSLRPPHDAQVADFLRSVRPVDQHRVSA